MPAAVAFTDSTFVTATTANPVTFTARATGTAAADRKSVVVLHVDLRATPTGMTINGIAATRRIFGTNTTSTFYCELWDCDNPTGTTGNVVITFANAVSATVGIGIYSVTGASAAPTDTDAPAGGLNLSAIISTGLTIPTDGVGIFGVMCGNQTTAFTWTAGATENYDVNMTGGRQTAAVKTTSGTVSIQADGGNNDWYAMCAAAWGPAAGGALTKAIADGLTLSDVRSGIAQYIRGLPDPMTMGEVFSRLAQYQRYSADFLTLSESLNAVKALMRAFIDPLTMGENLAATKALLRAYADALILGELVDKQITMAAYSDDFNRTNSVTPGASWNENVTGVVITGNTLGFTDPGSTATVVWTQPVAVSCQYQKATFWYTDGEAVAGGMLFRCSNTTNGSCYQVIFDAGNDLVVWYEIPNMSTPWAGNWIAQASLFFAPGDVLGVTLELTGTNTVVRVWRNPTGLPTRANNWNGDTTPDVTLTQNPPTPRDAGTFLGLLGAPLEAGSTVYWDNWFGGGCLESTGVLWAEEILNHLVMGEAFATLATLRRANADPLTLSEAMVRVAALQRYSMDALTVGENVVKTRALVRSYLDALTLGEALSKRPGKVFADAITLGEAFAKQLQVARAIANPMTVGEVLAKQAQFNRSYVDPMTLNESLVRQLQRALLFADTMTLNEVFTAFKPGKSVADNILLNEAFKKQVNRGLLDLLALNEALVKFVGKKAVDLITINETFTKVLIAARAMANPIVLSEALAKQKQIGKALAEVVAMSEALAKVFVGIRSLVDPLVMGDTVSKQLMGAGARALADAIAMVGNAFMQLLAVRALADSIAIGEALAKQAQFRRSLADLITMSEALQKNLVLVRAISNSMTLGESLTKTAGFARSSVDTMTLNEAVAKMLGIARSFADTMTLADALAKSATFRRSLADVMTIADAGTQNLLRNFLRSCVDPIATMGDSVTKLFVLLRVFSDNLSMSEQLTRLAVFHRLPVDSIILSDVFARVATYKRSAEDALSLGESLNGISAFRIGAQDLIDLGELVQATGLLQKGASDPITLADVIDTRLVIFDEAWARRPYNIGAGGVTCP